ncbi:MAG: MFS transporter [Pseudomonadota bacterium]|nr:MFS transporter [Pseudomonadota bacterium]
MSQPSSIKWNLKACTTDGIFYSAMVGFGETYFIAFALATGATDTFAGLISVVPMLLGSLFQLIVPWGVKSLRSYRIWVCVCTGIQSLSLLFFSYLALGPSQSKVTIFIAALFYWSSSMAAGPAWSAWMGSLIPKRLQIKYFAKRSRYLQIFALLSLLLGGFFLQVTGNDISGAREFSVLFLLAALCRLISTVLLFSHSETPELALQINRVSFPSVLKTLGRSSLGKVYLYLILLQMTANVASPFFAPYMLSKLKLPYGTYASLVAVAFLAKFFMLPIWSKLAQRKSVDYLLVTGTSGVILLPSLWIISSNLGFLFFLEVLGGAFWAALELGTFLTFFNRIPNKDRASFMSTFNLLNYGGILIGSFIGGFLLRALGESISAYHSVFLLSTMLRVVPLFLMPRSLGIPMKEIPFFGKIVALRPMFGAIIRPIIVFDMKTLKRKGRKRPAPS